MSHMAQSMRLQQFSVHQRSFDTLIMRIERKNEKGEEVDFMKHYREVLQKEFKRYQQQVIQETEPVDNQAIFDPAENELELLCESQTALQAEVDQPEDEITRYLAKGLTKGNPRVFWKEHEHEYPVLAKIARDILSVPASGAGVERLLIVLVIELEMIKEYLSVGEAAMLDQTRQPVPSLNELEPISDNEEEGCEAEDLSEDDTDESDNEAEEGLSTTQPVAQTKQVQRKRCRSNTSEAIDDADNGLPLPDMPIEKTQARSGRVRKRPKLPEGFEIDKL
ncbi:uncharacterized protein ATNIH1004_002088 [Aspergillus tanneri]|uniref:HAT C-terminal dimerisation domain-containing protein n=1 Tax=Aspergillus tanneri TaxID=1220188 RepID=A0A5M9N4C4_9EURO|nr:uncharacterized protein ATNIH1004_002088 [Aspergillus tanneri]KAA8649417.1 hypothetical protein ATNIH1004_002088 [Aspergillus tanneri]